MHLTHSELYRILQIEDASVYPHEIDNQMLASKELWEAFPDMTSVKKCVYTRASGPDKTFVGALTTIPLLTSFELVDTTFQRAMNPGLNMITGLTQVAFRFSDYWHKHTPDDRWDHAAMQREAYYLLVLLSSSAPTLEYIKIPGETACPEEMSERYWPCLRHLVLHGVVPNRPLIPLLRQAPSLCVLDVQCDHDTNSPQFFIYPESHFEEAARMPLIRSLTLTNPSLGDRVFHYLSDTHYLSFAPLPTPYYHTEGISLLCRPIWNAKQATAALLRSRIPHLTELRMSVESDGCLELIHTISESFPLLEVLELHRFPTTTPPSPQPFARHLLLYLSDLCSRVIIQDVREISLPLASLPRLAELRLDLNIKHEGALQWESHPSERTALLVSKSIPQLKSVSFLCGRQRDSAYWEKYNVFWEAGEVRLTLEDLVWLNYPCEHSNYATVHIILILPSGTTSNQCSIAMLLFATQFTLPSQASRSLMTADGPSSKQI
jgi:hypothetical protein